MEMIRLFYPIEMMSKRREGTSLQVHVEGPSYESKKFCAVAEIDTSAILDGDLLKVFLVNRNLEQPAEVRIQVGDAQVAEFVDAEFLSGTDPKAENSFESPNRIHSCEHDEVTIANGVATVSLPPMSVYAGTFRLSA